MKAIYGRRHAQVSGWALASTASVLAAVCMAALAFALTRGTLRPVYADDQDETAAFLQQYQLPGRPCDDSWQQAFRAAHQSDPADDDCLDRVWSLEFTRTRGVAPTQDDWNRHYYLLQTEEEEE